MPKTHLVRPGNSLERGGCSNGSVDLERGESTSGRETPALNEELSCVFRGPGDGRRVFVVLEAGPRRPGSGGGSSGKRAGTSEDALRGRFGGVGVGGARSFARISSRSFWSPLTFPFVVRPRLRRLTRPAARTCRHTQAAERRRPPWCLFSVELSESEDPPPAAYLTQQKPVYIIARQQGISIGL